MALLNHQALEPEKWLGLAASEQGTWSVILPICRDKPATPTGQRVWWRGMPVLTWSCSPTHAAYRLQPCKPKTLASIPGNPGSIFCSPQYSGTWTEYMTSSFGLQSQDNGPHYPKSLVYKYVLFDLSCWVLGLFCSLTWARKLTYSPTQSWVQPNPTRKPNLDRPWEQALPSKDITNWHMQKTKQAVL